MKSEFLTKRALKTLINIGDIIIPQSNEFPAFSEVVSSHQLDELLKYAPESDVESLNLFLTILSFMPQFVLKWFIKFIHKNFHSASFYGPIVRELNIGLRGIIFSCYYTNNLKHGFSGNKPLEIINADITRIYD